MPLPLLQQRPSCRHKAHQPLFLAVSFPGKKRHHHISPTPDRSNRSGLAPSFATIQGLIRQRDDLAGGSQAEANGSSYPACVHRMPSPGAEKVASITDRI
jgi:hypothetical protein